MRRHRQEILPTLNRAVVEPLETRCHFADTAFALLPDPSAFIGPIYVRPATPRAASGSMIVRKLITRQSSDIALIDLTLKDNHPQLERGFWTNASVWTGTAGALDDSQARTEEIARKVASGGRERWRNEMVRANAFTLMDFEHNYFKGKPAAYIAQRLKWFKAVAPDAPVSTYGYDAGTNHLNYDLILDSANYTKLIANIEANRPVVNEVSAVTIGIYLLGPTFVSRDLKAFANIVKAYREVYPDKPLVALAWGAYHVKWNAHNSVFSDDVMRQYVDMIRTHFDGVAVWGPPEDNVKLLKLLTDPANRTRLKAPTGTNITQAPIDRGNVVNGGSVPAPTPITDEIEL